jgi:hypothetical protein
VTGPLDNLSAGIIALIPLVLVTVCVTVVTLAALAARKPATRRHYLALLTALTGYVQAMRSRK